MSEAPAIPSDTAARIAALEASLAQANAALAARDLLIDTLRGQIARLRRMQFGASWHWKSWKPSGMFPQSRLRHSE